MMRLMIQKLSSFSSDSSTPSVQLPPPPTTTTTSLFWDSYRRSRNVLDEECEVQAWGVAYSLQPPPSLSEGVSGEADDGAQEVGREERGGSGGKLKELNEEEEVRERIELEDDNGGPEVLLRDGEEEEMELLFEVEGGGDNNNIDSSDVKRRMMLGGKASKHNVINEGQRRGGDSSSWSFFFPSSSASSSSRWKCCLAEEEEEEKGKEEKKRDEFKNKDNDYQRIHERENINVCNYIKKEEDEDSRLNWLFATAICGNDITSSAFYNVGSLFVSAGRLAPLCTLLAIITLYFYKEIYREVICAIPLNGGVYNCVLNSTDKIYASILSCLVILSYISTCVVSAVTAVEYFNFLLKTIEISTPTATTTNDVLIITTTTTTTASPSSSLPSFQLPIIATALFIIFVFALLQHLGLRESSFVALLLFTFHFASLFYLFLVCLFHVSIYGINSSNSASSPPPPPLVVSTTTIPSTTTSTTMSPSRTNAAPLLFHEDNNPSWLLAIASGLGSAISGFETAANFVEQQQPGVFSIAVNNMWILFSVVNLLLCVCSLITTPLNELVSNANHCVEYVGAKVGGRHLQHLLALDAVAILCGSVLSSFIGVMGLLGRMAKDNCLPSIFSETTTRRRRRGGDKKGGGGGWRQQQQQQPQERGSSQKRREWRRQRRSSCWSTFLFVCICSVLCYVSEGDVDTLSTIYTLSILSVLFVFAIAGLHLKITRPLLPRRVVTHWIIFLLAAVLTGSSLLTIWLSRTRELCLLLLQFLICSAVVLITFHRTTLLKLGLLLMREICGSHAWCEGCNAQAERVILDYVNRWEKQSIIFFAKTADAATLNKAVQYIIRNEDARWLRILHAYEHENLIPTGLQECVYLLDVMYPTLRIDCVYIRSPFNRQLLQYLRKILDVAIQNMFISCPKNFQNRLEDLGGVRVILAASYSSSIPSAVSNNTSLFDRLKSSPNMEEEEMARNHENHEKNGHSNKEYKNTKKDEIAYNYNYYEQQLSK